LVLLVDKTGVPEKNHMYQTNSISYIKLEKPTGQLRMDNPETRTMLDTRHRTNTKKKNNTGKKNTKLIHITHKKNTDVNPGAREG
jgi:hypothetical protein